jgi:hypothetical protein
MLVLLTIFSLMTVPAFGQDTCANGADPKVEDDLNNCNWYQLSSCCTANEAPLSVEELFEQNKDKESCPEGIPSKACLDYLNLIECARTCSPDQGLFFRDSNGNVETGQMRVCSDFVKEMWDACQAGVPATLGCTRALSQEYTGTTEPWRKWAESSVNDGYLGLNVKYIDSDIACFGGASSAALSASVAAVSALVMTALA